MGATYTIEGRKCFLTLCMYLLWAVAAPRNMELLCRFEFCRILTDLRIALQQSIQILVAAAYGVGNLQRNHAVHC